MLLQTLQRSIRFIRSLPLVLSLLIAVDVIVFVFIVIGFFLPKPVQFSYSGPSCVRDLTILPGIHKTSGQTNFSVTRTKDFSIGGLDVFSLQTCFAPTDSPKQGTHRVAVAPFGGWFAKRKFDIDVKASPTVNVAITAPVPTARALNFALSEPDEIFDYQLNVGEDSADCLVDKSVLSCDIESLQLKQGDIYDIEVARLFKDEVIEVVGQETIETLVATSVKNASIKSNQIVYSKPTNIAVKFDKTVLKASAALYQLNEDDKSLVKSELSVEGDGLTVGFGELEREKEYVFTISSAEAEDGSTLADPYTVTFSTSGGPKVISMNIAKTEASLSQTVIATFDQEIDQQTAAEVASIPGVSTTVSVTPKQLAITYSGAKLCTDYNFSVGKGLKSKHGIVSTKAYNYGFRTVCHTTSVIGYSNQGRAITAYTFGNGQTTVLYTGAIHGNELSARALMYEWIAELEKNAKDIPASKKVVIVPEVNPDGVAAVTRNNARNVDLNRNFGTEDWDTDVVTPTNQPLPGGGGSAPLSEPEAKALADLTSSLRPRLTLSFHSVAGYALGNLAGDSAKFAARYAALTGYSDETGTSDGFGYKITGTYDTWIAEKLNLPSVVIELSSSSHSEFSRNQAALWSMLNS